VMIRDFKTGHPYDNRAETPTEKSRMARTKCN
jgi:hypothetical protein